MPWEVFDPAGTELVEAAPPEKNVSPLRGAFTGENNTEFPQAREFSEAYSEMMPRGALRGPSPEPGTSFLNPVKGSADGPISPEEQATADQWMGGRRAILQSGVTPDVKAQMDILRKAIPGLEARPDKFGNVMVKAPGMKEFTYLNKPGVSGRDVSEFATQTAATAPFLGLAGRGLTTVGKMAGAATGLGASSVAQDIAAGEAGSEQGVDAGRAATSAAVGAASAGIVEPIIGGAVRAAGSAASVPVAMIRGLIDPKKEANRRLMGAAKEDLANSTMGLTASQAAAAQARGQDARIIDAGGETIRAEARRAANLAPSARQEFTEFTTDRFKGQGGRISNFLSQLVSRPTGGGPNAYATREQLKAAAQASVGPRYAPAYKKGEGGLMSPELQQLQSAPAVQRAMSSAKTEMKNRIAAGRAKAMYGPNGAPTLEYWDLVKRRLGDRIDTLKRTGAKSEALDLDSLRVQLTKQLDNMIPEYATARGTAEGFFKAQDALEAGENFVRGKFDLDASRAALANMTRQERDLFAEGFTSRLNQEISRVGDTRNVVNAIASSRDARERMAVALGPNRARAVEGFLRTEALMDLARTALGNSTTARQLVELGLGGYAIYNEDPEAMMIAAVLFGGRQAGAAVNRRVAEQVVKQLLSKDTGTFLKGVQQLSSSPLLGALRKFDQIVEKAGVGRVLGAREGAEALNAPAPMVPANSRVAPPPAGAAPSGPPVAPTLPSPGGPPAPGAPPPGGSVNVPKSTPGQSASLDLAEAYAMAQEAIEKGAPIEEVKKRLAEYGIDPEGLA